MQRSSVSSAWAPEDPNFGSAIGEGKMRISYVTETWPPEVNGVSLTVARTVEYLRRRGHTVDVVRPRQRYREPAERGSLLLPGMRIPLYPDLRIGFPAHAALRRHWLRKTPDLVHVATEGPLGWSALRTASALRLPVTSDFRTRFDEYGRYYAWAGCVGLIRGYLRRFHNRAVCTFVPTVEMLSHHEQLGFRNLVLNGRGVDTRAFTPERRSAALRQHWDARGPVALYVGRLAREKNLDLVFAAFRAMQCEDGRTRLVLVGDGPLRKQLAKQCPEALFTGTLRGDLLAEHYASADIFLFPSLTETFGNVTLEALASGMSVLAFRTGAAAVHVRDRFNGCVARPGDTSGFIGAARWLTRNASVRARLGLAARATALQASWETVLVDFEATLLDAQALGAFDDGTCLV